MSLHDMLGDTMSVIRENKKKDIQEGSVYNMKTENIDNRDFKFRKLDKNFELKSTRSKMSHNNVI